MDDKTIIELVPSVMSALATIAAAIAAFGSWKVSREAKDLSIQSALAVHHSRMAEALSESIRSAVVTLDNLQDVVFEICNQWPGLIDGDDITELGGVNPRPLRHVLSEAGELLYNHASHNGSRLRHAQHSIYSIIRDRVPEETKGEWERLLNIADEQYCDFSVSLGTPSYKRRIQDSRAFRFAFFQLVRRVSPDAWKRYFDQAWIDGGVLSRYNELHEQLKWKLIELINSIKNEKSRIAHSTLPLEANKELYSKYSLVATILNVLSEDCSLENISWFREHSDKRDSLTLIIYVISISTMCQDLINKLSYMNTD